MREQNRKKRTNEKFGRKLYAIPSVTFRSKLIHRPPPISIHNQPAHIGAAATQPPYYSRMLFPLCSPTKKKKEKKRTHKIGRFYIRDILILTVHIKLSIWHISANSSDGTGGGGAQRRPHRRMGEEAGDKTFSRRGAKFQINKVGEWRRNHRCLENDIFCFICSHIFIFFFIFYSKCFRFPRSYKWGFKWTLVLSYFFLIFCSGRSILQSAQSYSNWNRRKETNLIEFGGFFFLVLRTGKLLPSPVFVESWWGLRLLLFKTLLYGNIIADYNDGNWMRLMEVPRGCVARRFIFRYQYNNYGKLKYREVMWMVLSGSARLMKLKRLITCFELKRAQPYRE